MSALDLLDLLVHIVFVAIGVLALVDFLRHRDPMRRDVALLFSILAVPFFIQLIAVIQGQAVSAGATDISIIALVFEPYLLLRLVRYLRYMPAYMLRVALYGMIATVIAGIVFGTRVPLISTLVSQAYLIGVNLYAAVGFVRGVLRSTGVAQQRLRFAAAGAGLFALIFVAVLLSSSIPEVKDLMLTLAETFAILCVSAFYIGFAPPRWLRRIWQLAETENYLAHISSKPIDEGLDITEIMTELSRVANRAVGGMGAGIIRKGAENSRWMLAYIHEIGKLPWDDSKAAGLDWDSNTPKYLRTSKQLSEDQRSLLDTIGANALLITPIITARSTWGVLLVFLRYGSLFIEDDLHVVTLLTEQSAVFLEHGALVEDLRDNSAHLEETLQTTQMLYEASRALLGTKGFDQIVEAVYGFAGKGDASVVTLLSLQTNESGKPERATVIARSSTQAGVGQPLGSQFYLPDLPIAAYWINAPNDLLLVEDVLKDSRYDDATRKISERGGYRALVAMPLTLADSWLGVLTINWAEPRTFSQIDKQFYSALSTLVTKALETERLRLAEQEALQKLAEQEAYYRLITENISDMISRHRPDGTITYVSPSSMSLMGYAPDELTGQSVEGWVYPEDLAITQHVFSGNAKRLEQNIAVYRMNHRQGHVIWVETSVHSLGDQAGAQEVVAATRDISRRVEAEKAVQELNRQLEQRAKQLAAANHELEAFSYSVSHDLRAPLRALSGFSQALEEDYADQLDGEAKSYLQRIQVASQRMGQLIDDLLQLSQLTRTEMYQTEVNLSTMAREIEAELEESHPDRHVKFQVEDGLVVTGDARLLHAAMTNLLDNAWKYSSKTPNPQVEFASVPHNGSRAYFVRDNGAGFNMAYANKLFGAFQRLHGESEFQGIGIGLATVQRIVHRHAGEIWAEAEVGKGATFFFTLASERTP